MPAETHDKNRRGFMKGPARRVVMGIPWLSGMHAGSSAFPSAPAEPCGSSSSTAMVPSSQCRVPPASQCQGCPSTHHQHPQAPSAPQSCPRYPSSSQGGQATLRCPFFLPSPPNSHHSPGFDYSHKGALEEPRGSWREAGR